jgi:MFS family permease
VISRSVKQQSLLNAYWIPISFQNSAILTIAVPAALLHLAGANHTAVLAILVSVAGILAMAVPPIAGAISDHFRRKGMLRRPFILAGAVVNVAGLYWMSLTTTTTPFELALLVAILGQSISLAAYQPLIPEAVDRSEWGLASGYQGIATLVGSALGLGFAGAFDPKTVFVWAAIIVLVGAGAAALTPEAPLVDEGEHARIGSWGDFLIAFISRTVINFGLMLLTTFVLYFFNDVLKDANPSATTSIFGALSLVGAVATSLWMGQLSDRVPRKLMVALAGAPMAAAIFIFASAPGMQHLVLIALLFGLGYGAFASTGWALAIDSVPQLRDVARDLGIWGLASGLPGIFAPAFGGWLLAQYATPLPGYRALFYIAAWCFVAGSLLVLLVGLGKGRRGVSFLTFACALIYPYYHTVYRIRSWGHLPRKRGATIAFCNHQFDLDTVAAPIRLSLDGPWSKTIYSSGSRRMFEPGFLAMRLSWALAPVRLLRATTLFRAMGIMPIENELRTRSLASIAATVSTRHGNVTLSAIFAPATLAQFGIPPTTTIKDVFTKRWFKIAEDARVGMKTLHEPYRSEIFAEMRANIEPDYQRFEQLLRNGETLFLTPEGRHSRDGTLSPLLSLLKRLPPLAESVWLIPMSYDPLVSKRLSLLFRIVPPDDPSDLATSIKAARPVVTSQLIGAWLMQHPERSFTLDDAEHGVTGLLATVPPEAFVDPELRRAPHEMTRRALATMLRFGMLAENGGLYTLTARRAHFKFTLVDDMIAYQARFFYQTIEALHALRAKRSATTQSLTALTLSER